MILILEDNIDRVTSFRAALARHAPGMNLMLWSDARAMIREVGPHLPACRAISLDHDLYVPLGAPDPGDGLEVAKFLVTQPIVRPVIVHSSNADRAQHMVGEFQLASWPCRRVLPFGDRWVQDDWWPQMEQILSGC